MRLSFKSIFKFISSLYRFFLEDIWKLDFRKLTPIKAFFLKQARIFLLVAKRFVQDRLLVRASALVYATLLSIVPLLAVMFSLLKGFGYHNKLSPLLSRVLAPIGKQAVQTIVPTAMNFVENASVAALGTIGFLFFLLSSISIVNTMDRSFNDVWRVTKTRSLHRRIGNYLSVLILGPVLAFAVLTVTASLQSYSLIRMMGRIPFIQIFVNTAAPIVASWLVFYFLFVFIPNTKVRFLSALYGAIVAGTLWQLMNFFFARFIVTSYQSGTKAALYASFAVFPLFLVWLYFSWTVVLLGAEIAYVHQNLKKVTWEKQTKLVSWRMKESIVLKVMLVISQKFYRNEKAPSESDLAESLKIPDFFVSEALSFLLGLKLVNAIDQGVVRYAPAKRLEVLSLRGIIESFRMYGASDQKEIEDDAMSRLVAEVQGEYDRALRDSVVNISIRDLLDRLPP